MLWVALFLWLPPGTWLFYLAWTAIERAKADGKVSRLAAPVANVILLAGWLHNAALTLTWGTVLFLDLPRELQLTKRLNRLEAAGGWRGRFAGWLREAFLNHYDRRGVHT